MQVVHLYFNYAVILFYLLIQNIICVELLYQKQR